ncbi:MAG: PAS domain-containing protein [Blastocatellia bacterium]|nr:PAS domain-containing protein [Blastocatellia bacterium]
MSDTPIKLLIVEADANGRKRLKDFLASDQFRKYEIHETGSVRDGIEAYFTWSPQCLIVGLDLPDGRGLDLLQAIRTRTGAVAVPMVLLCSADEVAIRAQAVAAGAQEVLSTDRASADNLGWIVACAVERAARLKLLDRRNGEPKSVTRQLENDLKALGREIEVREKAEAELRASNQRYQSLVVASAQVVWTTDASGLVEDVPDWRVLTGQTTDQVRGRGWLDVLHPDDRARTDETWSACVQSGSKFETEYRVRTRTGEFRTFAVRGIPILDENGTVREWVGTCADVTDARRALEMLRERDEQLRLALTAGKAGTWRWELETKEAFWSEEYCSVFGLEPGSIKASFESWFDAVHPDDREHVKATVAAAIEGKQDLALAYRIVLPDGNIRWVAGRAQLFVDERGNPVRMIGITIDITDRKLVEDALAESEMRFRHMADSAPVLIWASGEDRKCTFFNQNWLRFTGREMEEELGDGWLDSVHPEDRDVVFENYTSAFKSRVAFDGEFRLRRADGEFRWVLNNGVPRSLSEGGFAGYIGSCIDITERREAEADREELLERERDARAIAEMASHTKDEFLAMVSHELRAPLNAILGWARILHTKSVGPETLTQAIETIERSARMQSNIIDDLLDTARITSGKLRLEVRPIDIAAVVDAAVDVVRPAADAKGIQLLRVFDPELDVITGDADRLQQVMWNLLSNAVRFTPNGGQVVVRLERVDPVVRIQVSDTGKGIAPEFLPQAFNRFDQADRSSTRRHGGLGLGLSLARYLVEAHGGTIVAESEGEGLGSTFTVCLPLRAVRGPVVPEAHDLPGVVMSAIPHDLGGLRILVVDDEADARDLLTTLLSGYGAIVVTAASAADAFGSFTAATDGDRFDIVVSDIGLPDEDGYSLIRRIRALEPEDGGTVPAVALTAYGRTVDRVKALSAGFQMHVPKPVEPIELAMVIDTLTRRPGLRVVR